MQSKWKIELISWVISLVLMIMIMKPVHDNIGVNYDFYLVNYVFIILFFAFSRYILMLKYAPFSHNAWIKLILLFTCIPLFFFMLDAQYNFNRMLEEEGLESLVSSPDPEYRWKIAKYVKYQFLFFSTGAIMTLIILPVRMVISIWRVRNKGTV